MVGLAEWVQNNKKPISCPFGNKEPEKYGFDISKADKIFDMLLSEGQIKLKPYHKISTDQELKNIMIGGDMNQNKDGPIFTTVGSRTRITLLRIAGK